MWWGGGRYVAVSWFLDFLAFGFFRFGFLVSGFSVSWLLGSRFLGFLVFGCLVSWFLDSWFQISCFPGFNDSKTPLMFLKDIRSRLANFHFIVFDRY